VAPSLRLRAGTRGSRLALWQTDFVILQLQRSHPGVDVERTTFSTLGDRVTDVPLPRIGDKGLFTRELEDALRSGAIDFAVHSLKDLQTGEPEGLTIGAMLVREDPRDALVAAPGLTLDTLPRGARVGTSSPRRRAQLMARRPDLDIRDLRGNVPTRVEKVLRGELDAAVLALAGLARLALTQHVAEVLPAEVMLPAPGQGALAVQVRHDDDRMAQLLAPLEDHATRLAATAERAMLGRLEGGCQVPVGALGVFDAGVLTLHGVVADLDGRESVRESVQAPAADVDAAAGIGERLAAAVLDRGADRILARVRAAQPPEAAGEVPES
jgi:hydroxymethylbilane synthase